MVTGGVSINAAALLVGVVNEGFNCFCGVVLMGRIPMLFDYGVNSNIIHTECGNGVLVLIALMSMTMLD